MRTGVTPLTVVVSAGPDSDAEDLAQAAGKLRERLLELDVKAVDLVRTDEVPVNAKPGDAITWGALAVTATATVLPSVVTLIQGWLSARPSNTVKIHIGEDSLELSDATPELRRELVEAFLRRHT